MSTQPKSPSLANPGTAAPGPSPTEDNDTEPRTPRLRSETEAITAARRTGLLGITVPRCSGGPALAPTALAEVVRTIAAADPAIAQTPQAHYLFVDALAMLGTNAQKRRLLHDVMAGARIGNALAERGTKHAQDLQTRLTSDVDGRLRLSGRKYYCTGALTARWIAVTALDEQDRLSKSGYTLVVFPDRAKSTWWTLSGRAPVVDGIESGASI
jgi:alkylation response protein AidB-like acyl-CoA dehydrogenase